MRNPGGLNARAYTVREMTPRVSRRLAVLVSCMVAFVLLAGVAGADSTPSFTDPVGDAAANSLDITGLDVSEFADGLDFRVTIAGFFNSDEDGPLVALDLDQNPDTGSAFYGTEVELAYVGQGNAREGEPMLLRSTPNGWDFRGAPSESLGWGVGPSYVEFFIGRADLRLAPNAGFNIVAASPGSNPDTAPNIRTFNYQPVAGAKPPALGPDTRAPHVIAWPSTGVHGKVARLRFSALDGRGKTGETIRIYRRARLLKTIRVHLRNTNPFVEQAASWRVPKQLRGRLRFSVRAVDAAGNRSPLRWASLVVR